MYSILPYLGMISVFLIWHSIYKMRENKHKDYEDITNFDLEDETLYAAYKADLQGDYNEKYEKSFYYRNIRKYTVDSQKYISKFVSVKYLEMLDDALEQSGRKYNMKAIEFITSAIASFGIATLVCKVLFMPLNYSILIGFLAAFLFPINDVLIEPRKKRRKLIKLELPNVLDFFYILMKAGNSFDESLKEIASKNESPLADEFRRIIDEIENKKIPAAQAYMNSAKRVNLDSYTNFIKAIQASQDMGANVIQNIKEKSDDLKNEYMTEKEKQIESLENKIIVPIVIFFMPPVVFALFGPNLYDMLRAFI